MVPVSFVVTVGAGLGSTLVGIAWDFDVSYGMYPLSDVRSPVCRCHVLVLWSEIFWCGSYSLNYEVCPRLRRWHFLLVWCLGEIRGYLAVFK